MNRSFNLKAFEALPKSLKPSDYVDFLLFLSNEKPCLRLGYNQQDVYEEMIVWCEKHNISYLVSNAGFMYISKRLVLAYIAKIIDDSMMNHTFLFGKLLGYPTCCSKQIAKIGESNIDEYEKALVSNTSFQEPYHLINPQGYIEGYSLISHIPCCAQCKRSLKKANSVYQVVLEHKDNPSFSKWKEHWL